MGEEATSGEQELAEFRHEKRKSCQIRKLNAGTQEGELKIEKRAGASEEITLNRAIDPNKEVSRGAPIQHQRTRRGKLRDFRRGQARLRRPPCLSK